jgi:hypothetical protein
MSLELFAILGGPELEGSLVDRVMDYFHKVKELCHKRIIPKGDGGLWVVFQCPGTVMRPDFTGIRTGSFCKKDKTIEIAVAVPKVAMAPDRFARFFIDALEQAVRFGKKFLEKRGIPFSEEKHLSLVQKLRESLAAPDSPAPPGACATPGNQGPRVAAALVEGSAPRKSKRVRKKSYQLVFQFPARSKKDHDALMPLENALTRALGKRHEVDGYDFGSGTMNFFVFTKLPERAFKIAKDVFAKRGLLHSARAAFREEDSEDFAILWPKDFQGEFTYF